MQNATTKMQKDQQQSLMAHWRVKMNPKSVAPLPIEGAPDNFNPKVRRSSAPANMQIRFKIDKRKGSSASSNAPNGPLFPTEEPNLPWNPTILISAPNATSPPKSPRTHTGGAMASIALPLARHTPYLPGGRSGRRHSLSILEKDPQQDEQPTSTRSSGSLSPDRPGLSPTSKATPRVENDVPMVNMRNQVLPPNYESETARRFDSAMQVTDNTTQTSRNKLPPLSSVLPDNTFHPQRLPIPASPSTPPATDQDLNKLITSFMSFPSRKV